MHRFCLNAIPAILGIVFICSLAASCSKNQAREEDYQIIISPSSDEQLVMLNGASFRLTASISPESVSPKNIVWESKDPDVAVVDDKGVVTAKGVGETKIIASTDKREAVIEVKVNNERSISYVDMGTSVLWATCNLGASTSEDGGDFYAWGETKIKNSYSDKLYKWFDVAVDNSITIKKYNYLPGYGNTDNLGGLLPEDDAARWNWGGTWRIPSSREWYELIDDTKFTYTWSVNGNITYGVSIQKALFVPIWYSWTGERKSFILRPATTTSGSVTAVSA